MIAILFDTETTGLLKPKANDMQVQPYITEAYFLKVFHDEDGSINIVDDLNIMVKPPIKLSAEITRITGITDADLENCPSFSEVADKVAQFFVGTDRLVAHNLPFDRSMLANELLRCDKVLKFPWPPEHICTVERSMHIEQRRMSLTKLHEHFFKKGFDAHRAKSDVEAMFRCYKEMVKEGMIL